MTPLLFLILYVAGTVAFVVWGAWMAGDLRLTAREQREWNAYWDSLTPGEAAWQGYLRHHIPGYGRECTRADFEP